VFPVFTPVGMALASAGATSAAVLLPAFAGFPRAERGRKPLPPDQRRWRGVCMGLTRRRTRRVVNRRNDMAQRGQGGGTSNRGFASMDPAKQRAIAAQGGRAAHAQGVAHEFDSAEAREAGRKGGQARSHRASMMGASSITGATPSMQETLARSDRDMQGADEFQRVPPMSDSSRS
jgi:general stress protein YciG